MISNNHAGACLESSSNWTFLCQLQPPCREREKQLEYIWKCFSVIVVHVFLKNYHSFPGSDGWLCSPSTAGAKKNPIKKVFKSTAINSLKICKRRSQPITTIWKRLQQPEPGLHFPQTMVFPNFRLFKSSEREKLAISVFMEEARRVSENRSPS